MRLKTVLLPEPLGPIRTRISPSATSNETLLTAVKPPNLFVSCSTFSKSRREGVAFGERQNRVGRLDGAWPRDRGAAANVLHHHRKRALVLSGELRPRRIELHAVALQRAARRNVGVERGLAQRLGADARLERLRVEQLRGRRIDGMEIVDVLAEALAQLVDLAVPGSVADQGLE